MLASYLTTSVVKRICRSCSCCTPHVLTENGVSISFWSIKPVTLVWSGFCALLLPGTTTSCRGCACASALTAASGSAAAYAAVMHISCAIAIAIKVGRSEGKERMEGRAVNCVMVCSLYSLCACRMAAKEQTKHRQEYKQRGLCASLRWHYPDQVQGTISPRKNFQDP